MLEQNVARFRASKAAAIGCEPGAFDSNALTIVERPADAEWAWVALCWTLGTGTAISVAPEYVDFVKANAPEPHFRAFFPPALVDPLIAEGARRGIALSYRPAGLTFTPGVAPPEVAVPAGLRLERVDRDWRERHLAGGQLSNALGNEGNAYVAGIWRYGIAVIDAEGFPAAVAGTYFDGEGLSEIGVDVSRAYRGRGLGRAVVAAMARSIIAEGLVPTYYCAPANVRSQRTALSCGFVPVGSSLAVVNVG